MGTFGEQPWNFSDPHAGKLPKELQHEIETEAKEHLMTKFESKMKKNIINTWKSNFDSI